MPAWESEQRVEFYQFLRGTLAWTASVAVLFPLNIPLMALAYKIRNGPNRISMPRQEFWWRSTGAALAVTVCTLVMLGVDYLLAEGAAFPAGIIHMVMLMAYVPAAVWACFVMFALDDPLQGLSVVVLYLTLPVLVLYLLNLVVAFWLPVDWAYDWLKASS